MEELDQNKALKQENETLKKQNEELQQKIKAIELKQKTDEELEQLRKRVAIEEMATEARKKFFAGLFTIAGLIGIASLPTFWTIRDTIVKTLETQLKEPKTFNEIKNKIETKLNEPETFSRIEKQVTEEAKKKVPAQVVEGVSQKLIEDFKKDQKFQQDLTDAVSKKIIQDSDFFSRIYSIASSAANISIQNVAKQAPNSEFSNTIDKSLSQRKYFVVATSSTDPNRLSSFINQAKSLGLKAKICPPKQGNRRSVLLVTDTSSIDLPSDTAQTLQNRAIKIDPTAYVLPTEPAEKVFFDAAKCR